jgi:2-keto-3-deoxy-L-rhamnonate aldolase RhmA
MDDTADRAGRWTNPRHIRNAASRKLGDSLLLGAELRKRAASGFALGTFLIELPSPAVVTSIAVAGFDFVVLDMEHSASDFATLEPLVLAARAAGIATLVRTWGEASGLIGKALDLGISGIMASHVETPERAREIVEQARYAPRGHRGFSPLSKYDALDAPLAALGDATYIVLQIEGRKALERAARIAAVPGIDAVFVGPYDLALSMGVAPGSEQAVAAAEKIARQVPPGVTRGIYVDEPQTCSAWAARGFALQCVSFDGRMLANGARAVALEARRGRTPQRRPAKKK